MAKNQPMYIANQFSTEGFDELQRLYLCWFYRFPVALDGPPGVGKTQSILEMARWLNKPLFSKSCSDRSTESHFISFPVLVEQGGASITEYHSGTLCRAMEEGGIFYGDEFNLLRDDLQKRMNCAFDTRREIDSNDGKVISAHADFWGAISYNPGNLNYSKDLDDSVADRFIHFHFDRWSDQFKAYVAASAAIKHFPDRRVNPGAYGLEMEIRGMDPASGKFYWRCQKQWLDFFTGEPISESPAYVYLAHDTHSVLKNGKADRMEQARFKEKIELTEFSSRLSKFTEETVKMSKTGLSNIMMAQTNQKFNPEAMEQVQIHIPSTRIESMAITLYLNLIERNCPEPLARSFATDLVINQICYGQYREQYIDKMSVNELIRSLAISNGLIMDTKLYATDLKGKKGLRA